MSEVERAHAGARGTLFATAFAQSRNPLALLDARRRHVDVNDAYLALLHYSREQLLGRPVYELVLASPTATSEQWRAALESGRFTGQGWLGSADGGRVAVQWAASVESVTGRRLVLFVALNMARVGAQRRAPEAERLNRLPLTRRELEIVRLVALGNTGPEIAAELHIAGDTVRTHARNAMIKLGARSRAQLVAKSIGEGLILDPARGM